MATQTLPPPAELVFYEKPGCLSNARQKALLVEIGHCLEVRNLLAEPWTAERLRPFFGDRAVPEWFNPTAPRVRDGEVRPAGLTESDALALMVSDPLLIRRPLIEAGPLRHCGFAPGPLLDALGVVLEEGVDLQSCSRLGQTADHDQPVCPEQPVAVLLSAAYGSAGGCGA
jgi:nitrogenase-associated protein